MLPTNASMVAISSVAPKTLEYPKVVMEKAVCEYSSRRLRLSNTYKSLEVAEWQAISNSLIKATYKNETFCFYPYSYTPSITSCSRRRMVD